MFLVVPTYHVCSRSRSEQHNSSFTVTCLKLKRELPDSLHCFMSPWKSLNKARILKRCRNSSKSCLRRYGMYGQNSKGFSDISGDHLCESDDA